MNNPALFTSILKQVEVSAEEYWAAVDHKIKPSRNTYVDVDVGEREVPYWLVQRLIYSVGCRQDEVAQLTPEKADSIWSEYQRTGRKPQVDGMQ